MSPRGGSSARSGSPGRKWQHLCKRIASFARGAPLSPRAGSPGRLRDSNRNFARFLSSKQPPQSPRSAIRPLAAAAAVAPPFSLSKRRHAKRRRPRGNQEIQKQPPAHLADRAASDHPR